MWELPGGIEVKTLIGHAARVNDIAVTPDSRQVLAASEDGSVRVWDIVAGTETRAFLHGGPVNAVAISPDGRRVVSVAADKTMLVWMLADGQAIATFKGDSSLLSVAIASDGISLVAGAVSGRVYFLRLEGEG